MINDAQIRDILTRTGAFLTGHFRLTSGLHSGNYLQCAQVFRYPADTATLCADLIAQTKAAEITFDTVISPALGGVLFGYELSRQAGLTNIFAERDAENRMAIRRGFKIVPEERFFVVEDVITTGGSTREVMELVRTAGARVMAVGCVADRSQGKAAFDVPLFSLIKLDFPTYEPQACPLCTQGLPVEKPGSRK